MPFSFVYVIKLDLLVIYHLVISNKKLHRQFLEGSVLRNFVYHITVWSSGVSEVYL